MNKKKYSFSYVSESPEETKKIGKNFAKLLIAFPPLSHARVINLAGTLGAGKTTITKGFARGVGIKKLVTSPTFVLMHRFLIKKSGYKNFFHLDAYRLSSFSDLATLGFEKILKDPRNIVFIEWKKNVSSRKIKLCGTISLKHRAKDKRFISIYINR